ncbi:hypothetical protein PoB_004129000 [Plakobranchus ocellatus]|uniref:Uncharacterized protein n=1 Tax=Plakobranchus ocellatus TaxID=259542 RepID=A0AAV4B2E7_9GAST|nr:hypothetical protein PoB_004129000 [Plakobranchus ocellatus]
MCLFGRPTRDFIPIHPGKYQPNKNMARNLGLSEIQTFTTPPQPDDQKFNKPLSVEESLHEPDLPLDDTNLIPTIDPAQIGDSTPHSLACPKDNRATHPDLRALRALKYFNKPGLKKAPLILTTGRITRSQKGSTEKRKSWFPNRPLA